MEEAEEKRAKEEAEKEAKMRKDMEESAKHRNKQVSCRGNSPVLVCVQTEISTSVYLIYMNKKLRFRCIHFIIGNLILLF